MPKIKTHKATSKRFRRTKGGKGKLVRTRQGKSHFRRRKPKDVRRKFSQMKAVENTGTERRVQKLAPYLGKKG
ncbi:MAG TPA: 50S ribosomal protein L35 [Thermoflexia bacterium]|nr:50S ribosomal protein L35 [Thermoflexia bacterium]